MGGLVSSAPDQNINNVKSAGHLDTGVAALTLVHILVFDKFFAKHLQLSHIGQEHECKICLLPL